MKQRKDQSYTRCLKVENSNADVSDPGEVVKKYLGVLFTVPSQF